MLLLSQFCTSRITQSSMSTQDPTGERLTTVIEVDRCSLPSLAPYLHHTSPLLQLLALASAVVHQTTAAAPPPLWPADNTGNEHFAAMLLLRSRTTLLPIPFSSQAPLKDHLVEQLDTGQGWFASFVTEAGLISGRTHPTSKAFVPARWKMEWRRLSLSLHPFDHIEKESS